MTALPTGAVPLPPARAAVLAAVLRLPRPTVHEVADAAGIAHATALWHLRRLRDAGLVTWEPGLARTLRPLVRLA